jgi:hypothetical protein
VMRSRPPWPQVTCELTSSFSSPPHSLPILSPFPTCSKFQTPRGSPELNMRLTKTTLRFRLTRSGTVSSAWAFCYYSLAQPKHIVTTLWLSRSINFQQFFTFTTFILSICVVTICLCWANV